MKIGICIVHKDLSLFPADLIVEFKDSILNQTHTDFNIYEYDLSGKNSIFIETPNSNRNAATYVSEGKRIFFGTNTKNHKNALNSLVTRAINTNKNGKCDAVFLCVGLDKYTLDCLVKFNTELEAGNDFIWAGWAYRNGTKESFRKSRLNMSVKTPKEEIESDHNVINNCCVCLHKDILSRNNPTDNKLCKFRTHSTYTDLGLWKLEVPETKPKFIDEALCIYANFPGRENNYIVDGGKEL